MSVNLFKNMEVDGIIPEFLTKAPRHILSITYGEKKVKLGSELTPFEVKDEPSVSWESKRNKYYTLLMFDPDAPSRQKPLFGDVKHWLVVNIFENNLSSGQIIAPYSGAGPPKNTGLHRYIFLLFEQKEKMTFNEPITPPGTRQYRMNFDAVGFMKKYEFQEVYAGNYFNAQYDNYVGQRHSSFMVFLVWFILTFYWGFKPFFKKRV